MSFFDTALAQSGAVQDSVYGELFLVEPRAKPDPNGRSIADVARPFQTITGIWTDPHTTMRPKNRTGHPAGESVAFSDDKPTFDFEVSALPYAVQIGDWVTRIKTGVKFAVADPGDDGFSRATVALTAAKGR